MGQKREVKNFQLSDFMNDEMDSVQEQEAKKQKLDQTQQQEEEEQEVEQAIEEEETGDYTEEDLKLGLDLIAAVIANDLVSVLLHSPHELLLIWLFYRKNVKLF